MTEATQPTRGPDRGAAHQTARTTAIVGGVFSMIFFVLLVANLIGSAVLGPARENKLAAMRLQVQDEPDNQELLAAIRNLDLKIRRDRLWRLDFAHKGRFMLLASVIVMLVSAKIASILAQEPPAPAPVPDAAEAQIKEAGRARWAVAGGLAVLAVGTALVSMSGWVDFAQAEDAGPSYASIEEKREQWHRFRGPGGDGVSVFTNAPTQWDAKTGAGILWKAAVPLPGRNSPVVWKDRVFLTSATQEKREVYCFDGASGQLLWTGDVPTVPTEEDLDIMEDTGYAASTAATDGRRIFAIFATGDIAAFDFSGRRVWYKNLGIPDSAYGYATSLDTYENLVLIQYDQGDGTDGKSSLYALDGATGRMVWETKREVPNSWTSPIVIDVAGQHQIVTLADPWAIAYDPADGREIWRAECVTGDMAGSPIYAGGLVLVIEPYAQLIGIKPTGQGDVTETHIAWRMEEGGPDICSPVANDQFVYLMESEGLLICCKVEDGEKVYEHDLRESFRASPSIVGGKLYLLDLQGVMRIARVGPEYEEIATCELGEECYASPAFLDGRIYIRGAENLYCIGRAP